MTVNTQVYGDVAHTNMLIDPHESRPVKTLISNEYLHQCF